MPPRFRLHEQRGLADPRWAFDDQEVAAGRVLVDQRLDCRQLGVALKQIKLRQERPLGRLHTATRRLSGLHRLTSAEQFTPIAGTEFAPLRTERHTKHWGEDQG